ncbi:MAG: 3'(2'),5'-bisphosphate nucleotidase CysQ, partial [Cyanobacteria bacterium J06648_11]
MTEVPGGTSVKWYGAIVSRGTANAAARPKILRLRSPLAPIRDIYFGVELVSAIAPSLLEALAPQLVDISIRAGKAILEVYGKDDFETTYKENDSPLTQADLAANAIITDALKQIDPAFPILSEESKEVPYDERKDWGTFWLVDPLDGTKEFIKRNGEFTVNIALISDGKPVFGVVHAPVLDTTYWG